MPSIRLGNKNKLLNRGFKELQELIVLGFVELKLDELKGMGLTKHGISFCEKFQNEHKLNWGETQHLSKSDLETEADSEISD